MMCDQYYDGTIFYGDDQRPYWTWFKNNYSSSRVKSHWIHLLIDGIQNDFNMLFDHANGLRINMLWLFAGDANNGWPGIEETLTLANYNTYLAQFCNTAFNKGFLRKFEIKVIRYYRCQARDCNDCYETNTWEMYNKTYGEGREVYP